MRAEVTNPGSLYLLSLPKNSETYQWVAKSFWLARQSTYRNKRGQQTFDRQGLCDEAQ